MKYKLIIIIVLLSGVACSQSQVRSLVKIQIVNDSIKTFVRNPEASITLEYENNSNNNLLLYGFNNTVSHNVAIDFVCDQNRVGAGFLLLIFNEHHERKYARWRIPDSIDYQPMPKERFDTLINKARLKYLSGTRILRAQNKTDFDKKIDLSEFELKKGLYQMQVVYYSGKRLITKTVGETQIEKDKRLHNAELFLGCAASNTISLIVE